MKASALHETNNVDSAAAEKKDHLTDKELIITQCIDSHLSLIPADEPICQRSIGAFHIGISRNAAIVLRRLAQHVGFVWPADRPEQEGAASVIINQKCQQYYAPMQAHRRRLGKGGGGRSWRFILNSEIRRNSG
eukprot:scaffold12827_cov140-Skeletonema_menzelii.AAC.6